MANYDDALTAAQKRAMRTGRSFFPAANTYRGININARPDPNAINSTPQGQTLIGGPGRGYDPGQDQRRADVLSRPRPNRADYTTLYLPSGGTSSVPTASVGRYLNAVKGSSLQDPNTRAFDQRAAYAKGYGTPEPTIQNSYAPLNNPLGTVYPGVGALQVTGQQLVQGGIANPVENLTPQQRVQYGVGTTLDWFKTNPSLNYAASALGGFGRNIASWFGGGNLPSVPAAANAAQPSPTPYQTPVPSPTGSPTPSPTVAPSAAPQMFTPPIPGRPFGGQQIYDSRGFKTTDARSDLLRDTEGTFYGGGQVPIPTPTPTPYVPRLAYGQPRRYSDNFGYS